MIWSFRELSRGKDRALFWLAAATVFFIFLVFAQEYPLVDARDKILYFWTKLLTCSGIAFICFKMASRPQQIFWQHAYTISAYVYAMHGEYFRPLYVFGLLQSITIMSLVFRQKRSHFVWLNSIGCIIFSWWMYRYLERNLVRLQSSDMFYDLVMILVIGFFIAYVVFTQINEVRSEKDRAKDKILLVGNQAVNIIHDLKSLASAPHIYSDLVLQSSGTTDPRLAKVLTNLQRDLDVMLKKTQSLYQMIQLNDSNTRTATVKEELANALQFLKTRMKDVKVEIHGNSSRVFQQGSFELIFLNIFYNSLDAWKRNQTLSPRIEILIGEKYLRICDNAGGASDEVLKNFQVMQKNRAGLGLYLISEAAHSLGVAITMENVGEGNDKGLEISFSF